MGSLLQLVVFGAALLIPAGTWQWPRAIQLLAGYGAVLTISTVVMAVVAPASLEARLEAPVSKKQPKADKVASAVLFTSILAWMVFIPTDVFRWRLLPPPSFAVSALGVLAIVAGYGIVMAALLQNAFATPVVRDQSDRGQRLIDTGPYAHVRHPFYAGTVIMFAGMALWLESYGAALGLVVVVGAFIGRIAVEERALREYLPEYADYTTRVPYRIMPYVW